MIELRAGSAADRVAVDALLAAHGMAAELDPREFLVATEAGVVVGAARVEVAGDGVYVRPIVVRPDRHARGIGRRLIEALRDEHGPLRVVARGGAAGFYARLGFRPLDWATTDPAYRAECGSCPDAAACRPVALASDRGGR